MMTKEEQTMNKEKFIPIKLDVPEFLSRDSVLEAENEYLKHLESIEQRQPIKTFTGDSNGKTYRP